jgi:hypothetical protein
VRKEGFEYRQSWVPYDRSARMIWSPGLQRTLQIEAGQSISETAYPEEGSGLLGSEGECDRCKRIRITVQQAGELTIRFTAAREDLRVALPLYDRRSLDRPIAVQAGEVLIVLVTGSVVPTRFELSTSLTPAR